MLRARSLPSTRLARRWAAFRVLIAGGVAMALAADLAAPPVYLSAVVGILLLGAIALRFPVAGLCLLALSVPWASGYELPISGFPVTLTDFLVAALSVAWLISARERALVEALTATWMPFLLAFLGAITLSATQAADSHASLREIVKWLEVCVVYLTGLRFIRSDRQLLAVVLAVLASGLTESALGYAQFAFQLGPDAFKHGPFLRAYGTFDQPNPYAGFLNMTLPFGLTLGALHPSRRVRTACLVSVLIILGAILVSESRGALIAGLFAAVVVLGSIWRRAAAAAWLGLMAVLTGGLLATFNLVPVSPFVRVLTAVGLGNVSFGDVNDTNFSAVERAAHWLAGVRIFASHPLLGVGIGNYAVAYPAFHPRGWYAPLAHAHNYYINIAAEAGIVGLTAYVLLVGSALWYSYAANRQVRTGMRRAVVLGVVGALAATSIHNLFDVLYVHGMAAFLGLLVAMVPVAMRLDSRSDGTLPPVPSTSTV